jgi:hypothetical protein
VTESPNQSTFSKWKVGGAAIAAIATSIACSRWIFTNPAPFELPLEFLDLPMNPSSTYLAGYKIAFREMLCGNYSFHFATFGALLGLALGILGAPKKSVFAIAAAIAGGSLGGAILAGVGGILLGRIASWGIEINWETIRLIGFQVDPFIQTTLLQCFIWVCVGCGIGLGCTLASFSIARILKGIQGGLLGGAMAGTIYSVLAAVSFSTSSAVDFVPSSQMELVIWAIICGLCIYGGLVFTIRSTPMADLKIDSEPAISSQS